MAGETRTANRTGPAAKQVKGVPEFAAALLVPVNSSDGVQPSFNQAGLLLGHAIPPQGGMLAYLPPPLPAVKGQLVVGVEFCAAGGGDDDVIPSCSIHLRWLDPNGGSQEVYTEPLRADEVQIQRILIPMEKVDTKELSFTAGLKVTPLTGHPILVRSAWLEMRT